MLHFLKASMSLVCTDHLVWSDRSKWPRMNEFNENSPTREWAMVNVVDPMIASTGKSTKVWKTLITSNALQKTNHSTCPSITNGACEDRIEKYDFWISRDSESRDFGRPRPLDRITSSKRFSRRASYLFGEKKSDSI